MAVSSFTRYKPLRLVQICINNNNKNKNNILPVEVTRGTAGSKVLKMHLLKQKMVGDHYCHAGGIGK